MQTKSLVQVLQEHPFVEGMKQSHVEKMAELATEVSFARDQIIFRQADESSVFYLILSGRIALEVTAPGRIMLIQTIGPGDELGWSSLLGESGKAFQARPLEPVRALAFDGARLRSVCEQDPSFGYQFMAKMMRIVARRLQATRLQLLDMYAPRGAKLV